MIEGIGLGEVAGIAAAMAWAVNGLLIRGHGPELHAIVINALRCSIAGVFFVAIWPFVSNGNPGPIAAWGWLTLSLVTGLGIGDSIYFEAVKRIGVGRAMSISMAYPVLTALLAIAARRADDGTRYRWRGADVARRLPGGGACSGRCRVGRQRGPAFAGLFQRPPSEPDVHAYVHPALQCLCSLCCHFILPG